MFRNLISKAIRSRDGRRGCSIPTKCPTPTTDRSFNEIMASDWEEFVIKFDKKKNDYVFRTACCPGAPAY